EIQIPDILISHEYMMASKKTQVLSNVREPASSITLKAVEAQERVETILRNLSMDSIQIDNDKKAFGVKCRFEGG
ncbi:hypothetical protein BGX27_002656, partial [Mortierella sp. AM989]